MIVTDPRIQNVFLDAIDVLGLRRSREGIGFVGQR